jgi:hypothetical protein
MISRESEGMLRRIGIVTIMAATLWLGKVASVHAEPFNLYRSGTTGQTLPAPDLGSSFSRIGPTNRRAEPLDWTSPAPQNATSSVAFEKSPLLDVKTFGAKEDGSDDSSHFSSAIAAATNGTVVITGPMTVNADVTVPANVTLTFSTQGRLIVGDGKTVSILGPIVAGDKQVFGWSGTGKIVVSSPTTLNALWWGAVADADGPAWTTVAVSRAANNGAGLIRISTAVPHGFTTGDRVSLGNVGGTVEANRGWTITRIDASNFDLQGSTYSHGYASGGTAIKVTNVSTGTDNTAAFQELSAGLTSGSRLFIPPAPPLKYYRISGAGASVGSPIYPISLVRLSGVEVFGAGPASRFYLSHWDNVNFDSKTRAYGNHGAYAALYTYLSDHVSIHDLAFHGEYGRAEAYPDTTDFIRSDGVKVLQSNYVTVRAVKGYNLVGGLVVVQSTGGPGSESLHVDLLDNYAENSAENAFNYMGGAKYGVFRGNTSVNCTDLIESGADGVIIRGNTARWTTDYAHTHATTNAVSGTAISPIAPGSVIADNVIDGNFKVKYGIFVRNQGGAMETFNGTFADATGWTLNAGWRVAGGVLAHAPGNATTAVNTQMTVQPNKTYLVKATAKINAGTVTFYLGGATYTLQAGTAKTFYLVSGVADRTMKLSADAAFDGSIDDITIQQGFWDGRYASITGNTIRGTTSNAIRLASVSHGAAIVGNTLSNLGGDPTASLFAIWAAGDTRSTLRDVRILGNHLIAPQIKFGVYLDYATNIAVVGNTIRTSSYAVFRGPHSTVNIDCRDNELNSSIASDYCPSGAGTATWKIRNNRRLGVGASIGEVASKAWDPENLKNGTTTSTTLTMPGATPGQRVDVWFDKDLLGCVLTGYVSSAGTVTVVLTNDTGADRKVASGTLGATVGNY